MKHVTYYIWLLLLAIMVVSCKDDENPVDSSGLLEKSWTTTVTAEADQTEVVLTFTAAAQWQATCTSNSWCSVTSGGAKGESSLVVTLTVNETGESRTASIRIAVSGYDGEMVSLTQKAGESAVSLAMNTWMDEYLSYYYLWNDEYQTLDRDLSIAYTSDSDNFLVTTLMGMETNTLDLKQRDGEYSIYSYVTRTAHTGTRTTRSTGEINHGIEKEDEVNSFGIAILGGVLFTDRQGNYTGEYGFAVLAVYPESPATKQGLKRGDIIAAIDNRSITEGTFYNDYVNLLLPESGSVVLTLNEVGAPTVELTSEPIDPTPIIAHEVMNEGGIPIGYLNYSSFDAAYDNDLLDVIKEFKSAGIQEMILDLRYNGGGYVITSNMLSTCLAGSKANDAVYQYYRFNDSRMSQVETTKKETDMLYDQQNERFYEKFYYEDYYGAPLKNYGLDLSRVFVLTTSSTASASEAVINSLRGIDMEVILIGEKSNGKNVGMEVSESTIENYDYELAPISFQGYNAKLETVDSGGISPDIEVSDWDNGCVDFGVDEPMIAAAIAQITGVSTSSGTTRSASGTAAIRKADDVHLPQLALHPRGMIALPVRTQE